jgi:hypothetical protein
MATDLLYLHLHLIQSALSQKAETKLSNRECSQGQVERLWWRSGQSLQSDGVALRQGLWTSFRLTGEVCLLSLCKRSRAAVFAVNGLPMVLVIHAITFDTGFIHLTDEVLRHTGLRGRLTVRYKPHAKGGRHVSVAGRVSPQPRLRGRQQRRSRGPRPQVVGSERQNLRVPRGSEKFMGSVSPVIQATPWPGGTSSCQMAGLLSNSPQQLLCHPLAVRPR